MPARPARPIARCVPINIVSRGTFARSNTSRFSSVDRQVKGPAPDARPAGGGGSSSGGTVRSVALTVPSALLGVTGSPVTQAGTLALSLPTRAANLVFAGPASGADAAPAFRALVDADIPVAIVRTGSTLVTTTALAALTFSAPPTQAELEALRNELVSLLGSLRVHD